MNYKVGKTDVPKKKDDSVFEPARSKESRGKRGHSRVLPTADRGGTERLKRQRIPLKQKINLRPRNQWNRSGSSLKQKEMAKDDDEDEKEVTG